MNNGNYKKSLIRNILIAEETKKAAERLGYPNHLVSICINKGLSPCEFTLVSEEVLRNVMKLCDSGLKNSFANKRRYKEEMVKASACATVMVKNKMGSLPWTMPGG